LSPAGHFLRPADADDLARDLLTAFRPRVRYRLFPSTAADGRTHVGYGTGRRDARRRPVAAGHLAPGAYRVRVDADRVLEKTVRVEAGERLLLELSEAGGGLALGRVFTAAEAPAVRRTATPDERWGLAVAQNQYLDGGCRPWRTSKTARPRSPTAGRAGWGRVVRGRRGHPPRPAGEPAVGRRPGVPGPGVRPRRAGLGRGRRPFPPGGAGVVDGGRPVPARGEHAPFPRHGPRSRGLAGQSHPSARDG
jgi:hypothetical protein